MARILVTGAGGFIGTRFLRCASRDPELRVVGVIEPNYWPWHWAGLSHEEWGSVRVERLSLFDSDKLSCLLRDFRPNCLVHFLATGLSPETVNSPENDQINFQLTVKLLEQFYAAEGRRFVFAGSWFEYGDVAGPVAETDPCAPQTEYARSKHRATQAILRVAENRAREAYVLRPFQVYGPGEHPSRLVSYLVRSAFESSIAECGRGDQVRDFVYVDDVADAFLAAAIRRTETPRAIYNVCSGMGTALQTMASVLDESLPEGAGRHWGVRKAIGKEITGLLGSNDLIRHDLDWRPRRDLRTGLRETVAWYRAHAGLYRSLPRARPPAIGPSLA